MSKVVYMSKKKENPEMEEQTQDEQIQAEQDMQQQIAINQMQQAIAQEQFIEMEVNNITDETVREAEVIREKYKEGKANLENKIVTNEQWFKLRHWQYLKTEEKKSNDPVSAWLFNSLANKHADAMDNIPAPVVLPKEEMDKEEAKVLSSIIPVIHQENGFEEVYDAVWWYKLKHGCGVYQLLWDSSKLNGLGDISIKKADILNLFWEPGISNIQDSPNFFSVELRDKKELEAMYPQLRDKLTPDNGTIAKYVYDDKVDTTDKVVVVDWYYKVNVEGRTVLHYCKYCNNTVLFATENKPNKYPNGIYDHGKYPFVFDTLFPMEGSPCGFGYIDICKSPQEYIDLLSRSILTNAMVNATPRYLSRKGSSINIEEFTDLNKPIVEVEGADLTDASIRQINGQGLSQIYVEVLNYKIDELKETSGNRDVSTGGTGGATAASAIAAMQEAGSKLSRDMIKASYRKFAEIVDFEIELIRQFYDQPRAFRIIGDRGAMEFINFTNEKMVLQAQGMAFGEDQGYRLPCFDIEVNAQKSSPYSRMSQNDMAINFYQLGFFNPQLADQSLACLEMMDFDHKDEIEQRISQNGTMYQMLMQQQQQIMQLSQMVDQLTGSNLTGAMMGEQGMEQPTAQQTGNPRQLTKSNDDNPMTTKTGNNIVDKSRQRVANSTSPT